MSFQRLVSPTALLLWSLAACSSGDGPTEGNRGSISIAMTPAHVSIERGATGQGVDEATGVVVVEVTAPVSGGNP